MIKVFHTKGIQFFSFVFSMDVCNECTDNFVGKIKEASGVFLAEFLLSAKR